MFSSTLHKYLREYAEKEAITIAETFPNDRVYSSCVVIPLYGEVEWSERPLVSLLTAARKTPGNHTLAILVVNEHEKSSTATSLHNKTLLNRLLNLCLSNPSMKLKDSPGTYLLPIEEALTLLVLDHTDPPHLFSSKEGVGIARKLGMDIGAALWARKILTNKHLHTTDGDALLAEDYFSSCQDNSEEVLLHPFRHVGDYCQSQALTLYELSLRYYVLGLRYASSPYAFHTIGSTISVTPECYASVRGFPKRNAAEDFYLLNKAAKTGRVCQKTDAEVMLIGRESDRVPFGTGVGTQKFWDLMASHQEVAFYHPQIFDLLRLWFSSLNRFISHKSIDNLRSELARIIAENHSHDIAQGFDQILLETGTFEILKTALKTRSSDQAIMKHIHEGFDAFRTLKVVHSVRDKLLKSMNWKECLKEAPFFDGRYEEESGLPASHWLEIARTLELTYQPQAFNPTSV